jgi:single-strand DNA-binding protein
LVAIQGRIQSRSWETKDGSRRYATEVVANQVQFLEWGKDNDIPDGFIEVNSESENIPF